MKYEMTGGPDMITGEVVFSTAVRYKVGNVWKTLCYVSQDGAVTWLDN